MAYDEKYRARAIAFKENGHTFKQLKEVFGIKSSTYYKWRKNKDITGYYAPKGERRIRIRKIDPQKLKLAIEEKPDAYLRELAEKFNCSIVAVHNRLRQLKIRYKRVSKTRGKISKNKRNSPRLSRFSNHQTTYAG